MIAKNNEEKRNKLWRIVMSVSTLLLVGIAVFFVAKLFTGNPLEGTWRHEDSSLVISIRGSGVALLEWPEEYEGTGVSVEMRYTMDRDTKIVTLRADEAAIKKAADASDGAATVEGLDSVVNTLEGSYDYSIEKNELTLSEREYGDQMVFDKL